MKISSNISFFATSSTTQWLFIDTFYPAPRLAMLAMYSVYAVPMTTEILAEVNHISSNAFVYIPTGINGHRIEFARIATEHPEQDNQGTRVYLLLCRKRTSDKTWGSIVHTDPLPFRPTASRSRVSGPFTHSGTRTYLCTQTIPHAFGNLCWHVNLLRQGNLESFLVVQTQILLQVAVLDKLHHWQPRPFRLGNAHQFGNILCVTSHTARQQQQTHGTRSQYMGDRRAPTRSW